MNDHSDMLSQTPEALPTAWQGSILVPAFYLFVVLYIYIFNFKSFLCITEMSSLFYFLYDKLFPVIYLCLLTLLAIQIFNIFMLPIVF